MRKGVFLAASVAGVGSMVGILVLSLSMGIVFGFPGYTFDLTAQRVTGENMKMYGSTIVQGGLLEPVLVTEMDTVSIQKMKILREFNLGGATVRAWILGDAATGSGLSMTALDINAGKATMNNMSMEGRDIPQGVYVVASTAVLENLASKVVKQSLATITIDNMRAYIQIV
ncbi:MAG: DUF6230 family protein [Candidatus Hadarchaeales archaeon]